MSSMQSRGAANGFADGLADPCAAAVTTLVPRFRTANVIQLLQDTLEYTGSPRNYLTRRLGKDVVEERRKLLSLPADLPGVDMYGKGDHQQQFEQHIATLLGKKQGLFFVTGVQAQLAAMKIWCDRVMRNKVAWHYRAHAEIAEENAFEKVFHFQRSFVGKSPLAVPTVADIEELTSLPEAERPAMVLLELPNRELGCKTYKFDDLVQISRLCRSAGVKLHMDGARLWEIQPFYGDKTFAEIAELFDSIYLSFYKGLRGTFGAMLVSSEEDFIADATKWRRRLGGNTVTSYPAVLDCERGYNLNIGTFDLKWRKMLAVAAAVVAATKEFRTERGNPTVYFDPEEPQCCQVHTHILGASEDRVKAARDEVEKRHRISIFSAARPWRAPDKTHADWTLVASEEELARSQEEHHLSFEWLITAENLDISVEAWSKGWRAFCSLLAASQ